MALAKKNVDHYEANNRTDFYGTFSAFGQIVFAGNEVEPKV
jgi:hypothetical protein